MKSTESKTDLITAAVETYLEKNIEFRIKNKILIAFSSGPDSSLLLDVLWRLSAKYNLEIICAYFNHCLRDKKEIAEEIKIAEKNCLERNVELFTGADDGSIRNEIPELGVEGAARKYRYKFLDKIFTDEKCSYTAFGHNFDDQIETVVMRFFTGSGVSGMKGIPEKNGNFIRPIITVTKKNIIEYLENNKIKYCIDKSNNEDIFLRNKIRNTLFPIVSEIFPGFGKSVISHSDKMKMTDNFIKNEVEKKIKWSEYEEGYYTDFNNFFSQPEILQLESLYTAGDLIFDHENKRIPYSFLKPVLGIHNSDGDGGIGSKNSTVYLEGYGLKLFRTGEKLFFKKIEDIEALKSFTVDIEDKKSIYPIYKNRYICIEEKHVSECSDNDLYIDPQIINGRLYIRYRHDGDRISLKGGTKKIKKLFTEMGIQNDHKDRIPLICDDTEILAVMGSALGYIDRIAERIYINKSSYNKVVTFRIRQV